MRGVWTAGQVRAAEQRVFTRVPESRLMRIAAYAVANEVLALLAARTGGTSGRRVGLLVGAGNNGGDALWPALSCAGA
ncbi:NAD(P)H-hydrate epimerase, partial [Kutzneria sp. 744]|uniref:NAD(P)H-hydrate epimerase n=1 Tax=Kutzneria sp. (strain 744) TaxID=345341 RepID=UPI0005B78D1A